LRLVEDAEPDELLRLRDEADADRVLDERLLDELDRFDPPLDLPVLRRSAIFALPRAANSWLDSSRKAALSHLAACSGPTSHCATTGA